MCSRGFSIPGYRDNHGPSHRALNSYGCLVACRHGFSRGSQFPSNAAFEICRCFSGVMVGIEARFNSIVTLPGVYRRREVVENDVSVVVRIVLAVVGGYAVASGLVALI